MILGITILQPQDHVQANYAYFPIVIDDKIFGSTRNEVYNYLKTQNIFSRKYFYPLTNSFVVFMVSLILIKHLLLYIFLKEF